MTIASVWGNSEVSWKELLKKYLTLYTGIFIRSSIIHSFVYIISNKFLTFYAYIVFYILYFYLSICVSVYVCVCLCVLYVNSSPKTSEKRCRFPEATVGWRQSLAANGTIWKQL